MRFPHFLSLLLLTLSFGSMRASAQTTWEKANARERFTAFRNGRSGEMYGLNDRLFQSLDEGKSWIVFNNQSGEQCVAIDSIGDLFVGTATALYVSLDSGNSWVDLKFRGCTAAEIHAGALYVAADSGLYRSTDKGLNWTHLFITTLKISNIAFASTGEIFIVQTGVLTRLKPNGSDPKVVFTTAYLISSIYTALPSNVFLTIAKDIGGDLELSTDNGDSPFLEIGYGNTVLNGVVVSDSEKLYAVGGVQDITSSIVRQGFAMEAPETFASTTDISKGLPAADVRVLTISPKGRLVVSTDSGIYRSVRSVNAVDAEAAMASGVSFYPNPYSSFATLELTTRRTGQAEVLIYDLLGRFVSRNFSGVLPPGAHSISLSHLPMRSGTYFCRVRVDTEISTLQITRLE